MGCLCITRIVLLGWRRAPSLPATNIRSGCRRKSVWINPSPSSHSQMSFSQSCCVQTHLLLQARRLPKHHCTVNKVLASAVFESDDQAPRVCAICSTSSNIYCFLCLTKLVELSEYNERSVTYPKTATSAAPNALAELTRYVITLNKRSWHRREYLYHWKLGFLDLFMSVISKDNDKFKSFKSLVI